MSGLNLDKAIKKLPTLYCRVDDLEKTRIKYTVENYAELLVVTGQRVNTFAFVLNSQGTPWLPGSLGGSYYGKGLYIWTGDMWVSSNIDLNAALSDISADKVDKVVGYSLTKNDLTDSLKTAYDNVVNWISTNGTNLINHLSNTSNPHEVGKEDVGLGNVPNTDFTNEIADKVDKVEGRGLYSMVFMIHQAEQMELNQIQFIKSINNNWT
tara:strand:+ start:5620 stop:6249 length:630 start_codon:yes stop_codon:yes gene_type:complete